MRPTVAVDFDGVLHPYTRGWIGEVPDDEAPSTGAQEFLEALNALGFRIVVFSARARYRGRLHIWAWLQRHGLGDLVASVTSEKPSAVAYVDDRAVPFGGDWSVCLDHVKALADRTRAAR